MMRTVRGAGADAIYVVHAYCVAEIELAWLVGMRLPQYSRIAYRVDGPAMSRRTAKIWCGNCGAAKRPTPK